LTSLPSPEKRLPEFDTFAADYQDLVSDSVRITGESSDYFAAYKAEYIARRVAPRPGSSLLDYGCGVGLLSKHLRNRLPAIHVDGFDVSQNSIERVDESLRSQGTFTSNLHALGQAYDVIVLANVLHHVPPARRRDLIRETASLLCNAGEFVIFEHNPINPLTQWAVSQCAFDEDAILLPVRETRGYFERSQFRLTSCEYIVFFPRFLRRLRPLEPSLRWCPLGAQYVVVASRNP
jgi:2-polyprenyl-3-methyl-5-hydroxy-6-metoxy-1,4-benzoquinol methylase